MNTQLSPVPKIRHTFLPKVKTKPIKNTFSQKEKSFIKLVGFHSRKTDPDLVCH